MSLPSGYKRLEYIQSSGTQYIDTGFKPNQNTRITIDAIPLDVGSSQQGGFFFGSSYPVLEAGFEAYVYGSDFTAVYNGAYQLSATKVAAGTRLTVDFNKSTCTVDAGATKILQAAFTSTTFTSSVNLYLLMLPRQSRYYGICKLYACKIYDNGTLIRNFIPCKNSSGTIGLWDDVNSKFYTNAGTGVFTAGPEVARTHKALINGTAYEAKSGKCLINGTGYAIQKGRTLIDGTGYDIELPNDADGLTWYLNETVDLTSDMEVSIGFYSNAERYTGIGIMDFMGRSLVYRIASSNSWGIRFGFGRWEAEGYRTLVFDELPTGTLLEWLQANGTAI